MKLVAVVVVVVVGVVASAAAEPPDPWAVPRRGEALGRAVLEVSLTRHRVGAPLSVAPDLAFGVARRSAVAVHTSRFAEGRTGAGNGLCVRAAVHTVNEPAPPCDEQMSGLTTNALTDLGGGATARLGVGARRWSPVQPVIALGVALRFRRGWLWGLAAPGLELGVGRSDANRDRLHAPVYVGATSRAHELHLRSGIEGALETFADTYSVPIGAGASTIVRGVRVGVEVSLDKAIGPLSWMTWRTGMAYVEARR